MTEGLINTNDLTRAQVEALKAERDAAAQMTPINNDSQIRAILLPCLRERALWVCEEFPCDGRVDVATVEGDRLCGYEIKAARDTLKRLFGPAPEVSQVRMYSTLFDRLTVVCAPNHRDELLARLPAWWGVTVVEGGAFRVVREAQQNPADTTERLGWTMWLGEARSLLVANGGARGARDRLAIANRMKELPAAVVRQGALSAMMRRPWGGARKRKPTRQEVTSARFDAVEAEAAPTAVALDDDAPVATDRGVARGLLSGRGSVA